MDIIPSVSGASQPLTVTVTATKLATGAVVAQGTASTNVTAKATATPVSTTKHTTPSTTYYPAAHRATNLYGYGDLAVHFTSVAPSANTTAVTFVIENDGTNVITSGWTFNATLPINGSYTFGSQPQQTLYPGDKIAYTLRFAGTNPPSPSPYQYNQYNYSAGYQTSGYNCNGFSCNNNNYLNNSYPNYQYGNYGYQTAVVTITADPQNYVPEYNKGNNTAQTTIPLY